MGSLLPLVSIVILALAVHLLPLAISPYPFNNDGLPASVSARDILESGHLYLPNPVSTDITTHSESTPVFAMFLAFVGGTIGEDPLFVSQIAEAGIALLLVACVYLIVLEITRDVRAALIGAFVISVFGSFLFLTASVWREALGASLFVLLIFVYTRRNEGRMRVLEILILLLLPFVHHLVALIAYAAIGYLTVWSIAHAIINHRVTRRHYQDFTILVCAAIAALVYYNIVAFGRLAYLEPLNGLLPLMLIISALSAIMIAVLNMKKHWKGTFAPVVAGVLLLVVLWDYWHPIFSYVPSSPDSIIILYAGTAVLLAFGWYGIEMIIDSKSSYRAIPLCMLLPAITVILFAIFSPAVESKHQIVYRSFDFADPALAVGAGIASVYLFKSKRARKTVILLVTAAIITLPFGVFTQDLLGLQHETQSYEVDALQWAKDTSNGTRPHVQTDVRLAYIGSYLLDMGEDNRLPQNLIGNKSLAPKVYLIYQEYWTTRGVNDFPHGLVRPNASFMQLLMNVHNVMYIGGDVDNRLIIFFASSVGQEYNHWSPEP